MYSVSFDGETFAGKICCTMKRKDDALLAAEYFGVIHCDRLSGRHRKGLSPYPWRVGSKVYVNIYDATNRWIGVADQPSDAGEFVAFRNRLEEDDDTRY